jgi:hypothetical protein
MLLEQRPHLASTNSIEAIFVSSLARMTYPASDLQAYRESIAWMYSGPEALERYAEFAGVSESVARLLRDDFYTRDMLSPDKIVGIRAIVRDAVAERYFRKRLSRRQLRRLVQIPRSHALALCSARVDRLDRWDRIRRSAEAPCRGGTFLPHAIATG